MGGRLALARLTVAAASALAAGVLTAAAQAAATPIVRCGEVMGSVSVTSGTQDGARVVLGVVSVPPVRIQRAVTNTTASWTYWAKWGLAIHTGTTPVEVSVPAAWRARVAVAWGAAPPAGMLRFAPCRRPGGLSGSWNGYAGGFYLRAPAECVPLTVTAGRRSQTVRVGIGKSCTSR